MNVELRRPDVRLFNRKSRPQRLLETLKDAAPTGDKAVKAGLIAGGLAGLTAGSAGISSLRRRKEARDDS